MRALIRRLLVAPSIYQLIYATYLAMVVPFGLALAITLSKVGDLAAMSRMDVLDAQQATIDAQTLAERLGEMERVTLQYRVLRDTESRLVYEAARAAFLTALHTTDSTTSELHGTLVQLRRDEAQVFALLPGRTPADQRMTLQFFSQLYRATQSLLAQSQMLVTRYANQPPAAALAAQRTLIAQLALVLPAAVLLGAVLLRLIIRPLQDVAAAIQQLGRGELDAPIGINGPRDLAELGQRLDWLRRRLRDLETEKMSFLRNISHELKTPLTSIREGSDLLRQDYPGGDTQDQAQIAQILYENSLRLQLLIDNLLHFNRAERAPAHGVETLRLDLLVERVLGEHRLAITNKGLTINRELAATETHGNVDQLHSVVDNLVSNAVKFCRKRGQLLIRLTNDTKFATLDVIDDGPGIDAHDVPRIFDLFYQGAPPQDAMVKGTGLGLAIARDFVESHGGSIAAMPSATGAHLRVRLPLNTPANTTGHAAAAGLPLGATASASQNAAALGLPLNDVAGSDGTAAPQVPPAQTPLPETRQA